MQMGPKDDSAQGITVCYIVADLLLPPSTAPERGSPQTARARYSERSRYNSKELRMGTTEPATPTTAEEQVTKAKLMEDLRTVFGDVEELLKATASQTGERITAARAKAEESLKVAKARLAEVQAAVATQTKAVAKTTDDMCGLIHGRRWASPRRLVLSSAC